MKGKRGQPKDTKLAAKYQDVDQCTTVMIRSIPNAYTQTELLSEVVEVLGSADVFDFFYLPWDFHSNCNMSYAFVNFLDSSIAQQAVKLFTNYKFRTHEARRTGQVLPAHVQGLQNNLRHLQDRAVAHGNHPCSPIVMWRGRKIELSRISRDVLQQFREPGKGFLDDSSLPGQAGAQGGFMDQVYDGQGGHGGAMQSSASMPGSSRTHHPQGGSMIDANIALLLDKAADMCAADMGQDRSTSLPGFGSTMQANPATRDGGQPKDSLLAEKYQAVDEYTTIMIRNIPSGYTQDELLLEVGGVMGDSADMFDFFYLPWDFQINGNIGYAFVNFRDCATAQLAVELFTNYRFKLRESRRLAQILPAHIQGLRNNLMHLQDRAVANGNHPCSPVVMWKGRKIELSKISQELRTRDALRKFRAPAEWADGGRGSVDDSVIPSKLRVDMAGSSLRRAPPASQPSSAKQAEGRIAEEFAEILDRVAGVDFGSGNMGLPLAMSAGARKASRNSAAMSANLGIVGNPGVADFAGMSGNPGMPRNPGMAGISGLGPFGRVGSMQSGGMDCSLLGADPEVGGPANRTASDFFEDGDEAAARLSTVASDNSTGSVPSFKMPSFKMPMKPHSASGVVRRRMVADACGGKLQPPLSAPSAGSQQHAALGGGYPNMAYGPVATPPGSNRGQQQQQLADRGCPATPPGLDGGHQPQLPCDSRGWPPMSPPASNQGHPQRRGHPQQMSCENQGWLSTPAGSVACVCDSRGFAVSSSPPASNEGKKQQRRVYHGGQSTVASPPGSHHGQRQPMADRAWRPLSATPPGSQRGHQQGRPLHASAGSGGSQDGLASQQQFDRTAAPGLTLPDGSRSNVAARCGPPAPLQVIPPFAPSPGSDAGSPGLSLPAPELPLMDSRLAMEASAHTYSQSKVQPPSPAGGFAAPVQASNQTLPSPFFTGSSQSASSLSASLPATSMSSASLPAPPEAADGRILEITVQNAHVDVLQKFFTKFGT